MLFHGIKLFYRLCKKNSGFTVLSIICIFSSLFSFIFVVERGYYQYVVNVDTEQDTQVLYLSSNNEQIITDVYHDIIDNPMLPSLKNATVSGDIYSGLFWDTDKADPYYTPHGRFFNNEEMSSEAHVALLGIGYLSSVPFEIVDTIWDSGIKIKNIPFEAIGNYNLYWADSDSIPSEAYTTLPLPTPVTIPINTFFALGLKATQMRCVFSQPITEEQATYLNDLFAAYSELQELKIPKTEKISQMEMLTQFTKNIAPYVLIILLATINTANIIIYWLQMEFVRFQIYRTCGATNGNIIFFISFQVSLLIFIGYVCAYMIQNFLRKFAPNGMVVPLPASWYWLILASLLLFMLILVLIKAFSLLSNQNLVNFNI